MTESDKEWIIALVKASPLVAIVAIVSLVVITSLGC